MRSKKIFWLLFFVCSFSLMAIAPPGQQKKKSIYKIKPVLKLLRPDLTVKIKCPDKAYPGQALGNLIKVKVKNEGTASAANFSVDIVLSSNTWIPVKFASYSASYSEDVLLKGGREGISLLAAGAKVNVTMNGSNKIPADTPPGKYYIGVVVDPGKKVTEIKEDNNTAVCPITIGPHITHVYQPFTWEEAPVHEIKVEGMGFGSVKGGKSLKIGSHALVWDSDWNPNHIWCTYPGNIAHGKHYKVYMIESGSVISNKHDFFLKMVLFQTHFFPTHQRSPGTVIQADTVGTGSSQGAKKLMIGDTEAQIQSWGLGGITFIIPDLPPGTYNVCIKKSGKTLSNVVTFIITAS